MIPKILIVDDEPLNVTTIEAFLAGQNYELLVAENGIEACATAEREHPDLILLDVMMPDMDGFAVTRRIRSHPVIGRVPIILVTALDDERSRLEGLQAGADEFLTKPCRREEIRARVKTVVSLNRFRALAEQRERFERLFSVAPGGMVLVDDLGTVMTANARALGQRPGDSVYHAFGADSAEVLRALVARADEAPAAELTDPSTQRTFQVRAVAVPEGDDRRVMLSFDDITPQVKARQVVERANAELEKLVRARTRELEESNRLLMSYANFVSHDLRSPLTVVKGYLSMVHEGVVPLREAAPVVAQAYQGAVMMQEMIENILQLAQEEHDRSSRKPARRVNPTPVVRRLAVRLRDLYPHPAPRFEIAELPPVGVSPVLIDRVFYNLLSNALKYSSQRTEPRIEVGAQESAEGPVIFVRDNGVGFDGRDSDKLFAEFSRLGTAQGTVGVGLGLSLVSRLLQAHGGRIWAESSVGEGATFYVQFPPAAAERAPMAARAQPVGAR